jgi:hypothetical protein
LHGPTLGCARRCGSWRQRTTTGSTGARPDDTFVVFADAVFRYPRGDPARRAEVENHARSCGVPEPQLDWEE